MYKLYLSIFGRFSPEISTHSIRSSFSMRCRGTLGTSAKPSQWCSLNDFSLSEKVTSSYFSSPNSAFPQSIILQMASPMIPGESSSPLTMLSI